MFSETAVIGDAIIGIWRLRTRPEQVRSILIPSAIFPSLAILQSEVIKTTRVLPLSEVQISTNSVINENGFISKRNDLWRWSMKIEAYRWYNGRDTRRDSSEYQRWHRFVFAESPQNKQKRCAQFYSFDILICAFGRFVAVRLRANKWLRP